MVNLMDTKNSRNNVGTIMLGSDVRISDPCYDMDTWCAGTIHNVMPGKYECFIEITDYDEWGVRVSRIEARHVGYDCQPDFEQPFTVGVDSGQCGIFDERYFRRMQPKTEWFDSVCDITVYCALQGGTMDNACLVSTSGFGDGAYICRTAECDGKVVDIEVVFTKDGFNEDDEDYEEYEYYGGYGQEAGIDYEEE